MIEPTALLLLVGLGVWTALDGVSLGQFMVSRPLVAGVGAGVVLGDPVTGAAVGALLELLHLAGVPAGGARLPEPGPAAIPAVALAVLVGGGEGWAAGILLGVLGSWLGGASVVLHRSWNEHRFQGLAEAGWTPTRLRRSHWLALAQDGVRGGSLVLGGLFLVLVLAPRWPSRWVLSLEMAAGLALLAGAFALGSVIRGSLATRPRSGLLLLLGGGVVGGLMGLVVGMG